MGAGPHAIPPQQPALASLSGPRFLDHDVAAHACQWLGLVGAQAKLHKLLLYEPGSFFRRHKDSQKELGMIGNLVVCLLSEHEGSEVGPNLVPRREACLCHCPGVQVRHDSSGLVQRGLARGQRADVGLSPHADVQQGLPHRQQPTLGLLFWRPDREPADPGRLAYDRQHRLQSLLPAGAQVQRL